MTDRILHRGPDGEGFHLAPGVGLGIRRLAIIDLETGDQPITNEDESVIVVCNGEIYNHLELRSELQAAGHRFRTASDVEVIAHLYEDHGLDFVRHLRGMFGIALWDVRKRRLMLVRDRLGIKPLHYAITAEGLFFGSEQKAILAAGAVAPEPDIQSLRRLFSTSGVMSPRTIVTGISRLQAGHYLTWADGQIPPRVKMKWLREKHVLRRAMTGVLPSDIVNRKKFGMKVPTDIWLRGGLPAFAEERLSESSLREAGYFDPRKVSAIRKRHQGGKENLGQILSMVLGVQVWHGLFRRGMSI